MASGILRNTTDLAAQKTEDIAVHEMGHIIERRYGQKGLEIAERAYYNVTNNKPDAAALLDYLEAEISGYSSDEYGVIGDKDDFIPSNYREIIPEIMVKDRNSPNPFTQEYIRVMKELFKLW